MMLTCNGGESGTELSITGGRREGRWCHTMESSPSWRCTVLLVIKPQQRGERLDIQYFELVREFFGIH